MSEYDRKAMIDEANLFGLEFKGNISNVNLSKLISEFKGEPEPVNEVVPANPAMDPDFDESDESDEDFDDEEEVVEVVATTRQMSPRERAQSAAQKKYSAKRQKIADARGRAMKTHIITLTNKDNRENDVMTTAYLAFENQHFGLARLVPLDVPVELEQALIKIAARTTMTLHKDEIVDGKRTGNKVPVTVKKFAISYSRQDPE